MTHRYVQWSFVVCVVVLANSAWFGSVAVDQTVPAGAVESQASSGARVTKVLVFVEENHSLAQMQSGMPYLFSVAKRYAYASNYTAITHPSEPNYIALSAGATMGDTADHNPAWQTHGQSVFGLALAAGKTPRCTPSP